MAEQVKVDIVADGTQAKAEFSSFASTVAAASASVKSAFAGIQTNVRAMGTQMSSDLGTVTGAIGAIQGRFVALAGILAGGKVLKESVQATAAFTKEAVGLSKALGINTTDASALNVALGDVGGSADDMTSAASKLAKELRTNEDRLVAMGLKTRDASGNFRNMNDLLMDGIKIVNGYAEGTDRTMAKQTMFGKGAEELGSIFKLNNAIIDEAKTKQQQLGLIVGAENVEAAKRYKAMMNDVGDVLLAVKKAIGDAVMPVLTKLGEWFTSIGPGAVLVIKGAIGGLVSVFWGLKNAVTIVWELLDSFVFTIAEPIKTLASSLAMIVNGDFKGAAQAMMSWPDRIKERWVAAGSNIVESSVEARDRMLALFDTPTPTAPKDGNDGKHFQPTDKGPDTRMQGWEAQLAAQKVAHEQQQAEAGTFYEFGKAREAKYWQDILSTLDAADKARAGVQKKYYALVLDMRKADFEAEQAELQTRIAASKGNYDEQEMLAELYASRARQRYGQDSKEYQQALQQLQQLYRAHIEAKGQILQIQRQNERDARAAAVDDLERAAQLELTLGTITQEQLLDVKRRALVMREQIELEAKQAELQAQIGGINDPVAVEKIQAEIAAIKRKYAGLQAQNNGEKVATQAKPFDAVFGTSQQALEAGLTSMVTKMKLTLGGIRDVAKQVGASLLEELAIKPVVAWIASQARMVVMTALFGEQRVAMEAATGAEITAVQGASSLKTIAMKAYEAAAGAYSAIAGIPYVGPVLAPVAAGVALAGVMAFAKNIFSAEQGFDIPKGLNPMVQAHSNEMILPSKHADTMRALGDIVASGGSLQGGGGDVILQGTPLPGDFWVMQRSGIIKAVKHAKRNFEI